VAEIWNVWESDHGSGAGTRRRLACESRKTDRKDEHCGHGQNTCYSTLGPEVHLEAPHNKYWDDSDGKVGSHADDTIGSCRSDHHIGVRAVSRLIVVPVIGGRVALKNHYKKEAKAVRCDDGDGDVDDPFVQLLNHNPQQKQTNCNLYHDGSEVVGDFAYPPTLQTLATWSNVRNGNLLSRQVYFLPV
jgi:hypothetical protein